MAPMILVLVAVCGCAPAPSDLGPGTTVPVGADSPAPLADRETWDVLRIGDAKVGYVWTAVGNETADGAERVRIQGLNRMKFSRAGQQIELGVQFSSLQERNGRLLEFETVIFQGRTPMQSSRGRVEGDSLNIETTTQGKTESTAIPWSDDFVGPLASQLALLEKPMTPGEKRTVHELIPLANVVGTSELVARDYERVDVLGQTHELLRIDATITFPDGRSQRSTHWADRSGDVLRTHEEAMNMESLRATKEVALAGLDRAEFDLVLGLSVPVERRLDRPHDTRRIGYRLHLEGSDPAEVFGAGTSQRVHSVDAETAEVTVYAVRPDRPGNPEGVAEKPTVADTSASNMIQSDNGEIAKAARRIAEDSDDPWQIAVALERYVGQKITSTNYSQAFDTAAEVFRTGEGDCTEHAVLLAALARARGIPARVVIGLVYTAETGRPAFGYHMWNEVYVDDRWIPMDATLARGGIGAAHLKLAHTSLEGASAFSSFLPVAQVAGRLRIEIVEVE